MNKLILFILPLIFFSCFKEKKPIANVPNIKLSFNDIYSHAFKYDRENDSQIILQLINFTDSLEAFIDTIYSLDNHLVWHKAVFAKTLPSIPYSPQCDIDAIYLLYNKLDKVKPDSVLFYSNSITMISGPIYRSTIITDSVEFGMLSRIVQNAKVDSEFQIDTISIKFGLEQPNVKIRKFVTANDTLYSYVKDCLVFGEGSSLYGSQFTILFRIDKANQPVILHKYYAHNFTNRNDIYYQWIADLNNDSVLEIILGRENFLSVVELTNGSFVNERLFYSYVVEECSRDQSELFRLIFKK